MFWMVVDLFKKYFNPVSFRSSIAPLELYDYLNEHKSKTGFPFNSPLDFVYVLLHLVNKELAKINKKSKAQKKIKKSPQFLPKVTNHARLIP